MVLIAVDQRDDGRVRLRACYIPETIGPGLWLERLGAERVGGSSDVHPL
jgi:hypothetical protein